MLSDSDYLDEPDIPTLPDWVQALDDSAEKPVTRAGGIGIQWHVWGEGKPLYLLHGGHGSWMHWARNIEWLSRNFRVMAADLPSAGDSETFDTDDLQELAKLVAAGIDELAGGEPVRGAGFSFGSVIGSLCLKYIETGVDAYALVGSPLLGGRSGVDGKLRKWRGMPVPEHRVAAHAHNVGLLMLTGAESVTDEATAIQMAHAEKARPRKRGLFHNLDLLGEIEAWPGQLTVIYGSEDAIARKHLDERQANVERIKPGSEFHVIPDMGHWVQYQAADQVNDILMRRLD
ncbi:alpha/beta hydrolase [Pseudooceanicola sp.]|uniref:alpha/beta fold hydrolase n=1 Tax=Pseudooceanicola sp. TaxID=1914328 RepID=UPI00261FDF7B|nr:alpha/beta hydrolase [Pseudooceanicola sp.]MDF1856295.1 alpha/beta hydrolase [Pseudooceanicola sp.]